MIKSKKNLAIVLLAMVMAVACMFAVVAVNSNTAKADGKTFEMEGASIRYEEPTGMRFAAMVDATTYQEVIDSDNKVFGAIILPNDYLDGVGELTNHATQLNGIKYNTREGLLGVEKNGGYRISYSLSNVQYGNYNRDFFGIVYIKTTVEGTASYEYASVVDGNNVRSVAEVALADYDSADDIEKLDLYNYIFKSEYLAANPTDKDGEPDAIAYAEAQVEALTAFESASANIPQADAVAYVNYADIKTAKTEYAKLGDKAKALVATDYANVVACESALANVDGRVFGDAGMTADLYTQDTNDGNAKASVATSVITASSNTAGQDDYVYAGELGNMIKLSITKGSNGNWAINAHFDKIADAMVATGAESVSFYLYSNNAFVAKQIHVGTYWDPFYYETVNPGWLKITYTLDQVNTIVNKRNAICSDGTFKNTDGNTAEYWISDFFLSVEDETKVWGASFDASKFAYVDNGWANTTNATTRTLLDGRMQHKGLGDYVYTGEYGSLVKIVAEKKTGASDSNWAVKFPVSEVQTAMVNAGADYVEMYVYNNSTNRAVVDFGGFTDLGHYGKVYNFASGWNVVQLTLAEINSIVEEDRCWIGKNNVDTTEIWVSDFTLCKIDAEENANRVLGDLGMLSAFQTGSLKDSGNNQRNTVRALAQYVSKDTELKGQGDYTYKGEYGALIKITIPERGNWAMKYDFAAAKKALEETGAESVTIYVYQNNSFDQEYLEFGTAWVGWYGKVNKGWNSITLTSSQLDTIINNGSLVLSDCTFDGQSATTAEYWVSDFFLNIPA